MMSMSVTELVDDDLSPFLEAFDAALRVNVRSLVNAWSGGGGSVAPGRLSTRLLSGDPSFTAATIYAPTSNRPGRIEFARVVLARHGVSPERWSDWSDPLVDLQHLGFEPGAKYPNIAITQDLGTTELVRLVQALRDLAKSLQ